jgi:Glycosyl hydrolases family 16
MTNTLNNGDFPANSLEKPGYTLQFQDEFDEPTLDTAKWLPYYLPQWSSRARSAPNYLLKDSNLVLQITENQPAWCPEFDGEVKCSSIQTGVFSGALGSPLGQHKFNKACVVREEQPSIQTYTPQYGYFEIRAKGAASSGNLASLWMIGYEDLPEKSGEIALFEIVGAHRSDTASSIRYGIHPWADPNLTDEFHEQVLAIDTACYHLYAVEWTPTHVDFYVDNQKIRTLNQSPNYPMQFMLGLYEIPVANAWTGVLDPHAPYPKQFWVDYFRAYQPDTGYQS